MIEMASQQDSRALMVRTGSMYNFFQKNEDEETAEKAKQLLIKLQQNEYAIAFCGHFSAGKSSMINRIVGENLLPSSPIPTSANLVKIKSGEEYARVNFKEGNPRLYPAPYNYETVKTYCKDGDTIQSIEISHTTDKLPNDACIMDTPGIDSTDDAHRVATESALHLADLVFYVMDYNHVQSELNFLFTKELTNAGKEVYLVINQIDKHRDEELSFEDFKVSVRESFAAWGVRPAEIFYTSLKAEKHPQNEFSKLQQFIHSKLAQRGLLLPTSVLHSLRKLMEEHELFLKERDWETLEKFDAQLAEIPSQEQVLLPSRVEEVEQKLKRISSLLHEKEKAFDTDVNTIISNSYLMPYETRELAESFLQATQDDFKVGLFFAKQKTEQERQVRLEKFFADFQEKVTSQLTWHLKELFIKTLKAEEINDSTLLSKVQTFSVSLSKEVLIGAIKPGARLSGEYVLNYTAEVANMAKNIARLEWKTLKEEYLELLNSRFNLETSLLEDEKKHFSILLEAWSGKQEMIEAQTACMIQMEHILNEPVDEEAFDMTELIEENDQIEIVHEMEIEHDSLIENKPIFQDLGDHSIQKLESKDVDKKGSTVRKLRNAANALSTFPGFKKISTLMLEKAERIEKQSFTVALFGAFSAGKSSFANSLIGDKLLPVSPNPTTAAINKIMPVDEINTHGLVKVYLKREEVLFDDVNRSLSVFEMEAKDFDEALSQIKKIIGGEHSFDAHEKTHFSFLNAFYKGFHPFRTKLGEMITTDVTNFRDFVANEEKSCLVDLIEVHFDCELTRKGITLVDTPGADSINARHTGVAFDYIKNSDAILFVTYYNHAFSKADREFLIQLGRVKDSFEMDKMFFVVNAVDLANNDEEKAEVLSYVHDQLVNYGIRKPTLFPVSSLLAIREKQEDVSNKRSGIMEFENRFYSFITHDLTDMTINSGLMEWKRALDQLRSFVDSANEGIEERQEKIRTLQREQKQIEELLKKQTVEIQAQRLYQEIEELSFYIKQRVFFRFNDFFKEAFNPAVLRDDGRNIKKVLQHALEEFLGDFGFDFVQELRATTLRIEGFMTKLIDESHQALTKESCKLNGELSFSHYQLDEEGTVSFEHAFHALDREIGKKVFVHFKNPKSFFEKNEKRFMQEALNEALQQPAEQYLGKEKDRLKSIYGQHLESGFQGLIKQLLEDTAEYYEGMYAALSNDRQIDQLKLVEKELTSLSSQM